MSNNSTSKNRMTKKPTKPLSLYKTVTQYLFKSKPDELKSISQDPTIPEDIRTFLTDLIKIDEMDETELKEEIKKMSDSEFIKTLQEISVIDFNFLLTDAIIKNDLKLIMGLKDLIDITANNNEAIAIAAAQGHLEIVEYLHEHGADITKNPQIFMNACRNGHLNVVKYLVTHGGYLPYWDGRNFLEAMRSNRELAYYLFNNNLYLKNPIYIKQYIQEAKKLNYNDIANALQNEL